MQVATLVQHYRQFWVVLAPMELFYGTTKDFTVTQVGSQPRLERIESGCLQDSGRIAQHIQSPDWYLHWLFGEKLMWYTIATDTRLV